MIRYCVQTLCISILFASTALCQVSSQKSSSIFRLGEGAITYSPAPANEWNSCVVVQDSGAIYIEKRTHVISEPGAELKAYIGKVTDTQLGTLQQLLADKSLVGISDGSPVRPAATNTQLSWISVLVRRGPSVQEIDYRYWRDQSSEYATASASYVAIQKERFNILTPLVNWVHAIDTNDLTPTEFKPGACVH
jgi:hypothetical protein